MAPAHKTVVSDKACIAIRCTEFVFDQVTAVGHGRDIVSCEIITDRPVSRPMGEVRQTIASSATTVVGDSAIIVAVELNKRHTSRRTADAVNQLIGQNSSRKANSIGISCLGVECSRVRCKYGDLVRHCRIASKNVDEATTIAHTSREDTASVDTILRRYIGNEGPDEAHVIDCAIVHITWIALPCGLSSRVLDSCRIYYNTIWVDSFD